MHNIVQVICTMDCYYDLKINVNERKQINVQSKINPGNCQELRSKCDWLTLLKKVQFMQLDVNDAMTITTIKVLDQIQKIIFC